MMMLRENGKKLKYRKWDNLLFNNGSYYDNNINVKRK